MKFDEVPAATRTRDVVARIARREMKREWPPDRYGTIADIDYDKKEASVDIQNQGEPVIVTFGMNLQPTHIGQQVRVSGTRGDRYVAALVGSTPWVVPTLLNDWVNYGGGYTPSGYRRSANGSVQLRGLVKDGTADDIFVLPAEYSPSSTWMFSVMSGPDAVRLDVQSDGTVTLPGTYVNTFVSMNVTLIPANN